MKSNGFLSRIIKMKAGQFSKILTVPDILKLFLSNDF